MSSLPGNRVTPDEYLALERASERGSEYFDGEVFARAGAGEEHNLITVNRSSALHAQLRGRPCRVYASGMRVRCAATGLYTYPDIVVVCGERRFQDHRGDTLLNPTLIIEVLSPTTEAYDRGEKFAHYRRIESLREYVIVAQDRIRIERFVRHEGGEEWMLTELSDPHDTIRLPSVECSVALSEVYESVEFSAPPAPPPRPLPPDPS